MDKSKTHSTDSLLTLWNRLNGIPGGRYLFNRLLAWRVPYTSSIKSQVMELRPGYCKTRLPDRRRIRNHLNSIHAIALVNLGEMTSGLALLTGLQSDARGIVINISTEYFKKARGTLVAECSCNIPLINDDLDFKVETHIVDADNEQVAMTTTIWRLGLKE